jgi:hypothetical protein
LREVRLGDGICEGNWTGVLGVVGKWRWRLGFRKRGIRVGTWIDEGREKGCVSSRNTCFYFSKGKIDECLGKKR